MATLEENSPVEDISDLTERVVCGINSDLLMFPTKWTVEDDNITSGLSIGRLEEKGVSVTSSVLGDSSISSVTRDISTGLFEFNVTSGEGSIFSRVLATIGDFGARLKSPVSVLNVCVAIVERS